MPPIALHPQTARGGSAIGQGTSLLWACPAMVAALAELGFRRSPFPTPRGAGEPQPEGRAPSHRTAGTRLSPGSLGPPWTQGKLGVPSLLPPNADYKSQQASRRGEPGQRYPARGQCRIPAGPPSPPALAGGSGKSW